MKSWLTPTAVLFAAVSFAAVSHAHPRDLQVLKDEHHCQQRALRAAWNTSQDALRQDYKSSVAALNEAKRMAVRLCEPERSLELERIRGARQEAAESHRCSLDAARAEFRAARLRLEASYAVAASRLRTNTVFDATDDSFQVVRPVEVFDDRLPGEAWRLSPVAEPRNGHAPAEQAPYFGTRAAMRRSPMDRS